MTLLKVNNRPVAKSWNGLVNELFADFGNNFSNPYGHNASTNVPVNIVENDEAYHLEFAAPGRNKENFSLNVENDTLTVKYEEKKDGEAKEVKQVRKEFNYGSFKRSFSLNDKVNAEAIQAKYEDGLLKVLLPKKAETKPEVKQISVQ